MAPQHSNARSSVYQFVDDADESIQWNSVPPDKDDALLQTGEALVINQELRRLSLRKSSTSGDWVITTDSYFRSDGSLACLQFETTLTSFHARFVGCRLYGPTGELLNETEGFVGLKRSDKIPESFPQPRARLYTEERLISCRENFYPIDILTDW